MKTKTNLGLCGAHRTGKTTLALSLAQLTGKQFVRTRVSEIFKEQGLDPAKTMDFGLRLDIQYRILDACESDWKKAGENFITDRTPIDLMAYLLADIQGKTEVNYSEFESYIQRCFELANDFFNILVIIQPGIPLAEAEGKAALNKAYIEHINSLIVGLCHDQRLQSQIVCLNRDLISFEERIRKVSALL